MAELAHEQEANAGTHAHLRVLLSFYVPYHRNRYVACSAWFSDSIRLVPTFPQLQDRYHATYAQINYTVAIPALALAISPLFWTPFANIYGRRVVCILGCTLAFAATIGSALAPTYAGYMVTRFLQGWGVGPASTVGLQMLQDIYSDLERGEKVGYWTASIDLGQFDMNISSIAKLIPSTGLLFGPLLGGFAAIPSFLWPAWLTAILFGILLIVMVFFLPETAISRTHGPQRTPFLNIKPIAGLPPTRLWSTTLNCIHLFSYPKVCIPIMFYCWTWYVNNF
jgi:MFS family permease